MLVFFCYLEVDFSWVLLFYVRFFFDFGILLKSLEFIKIKKSESKELKGKNYNVNCYKKFQWTQLEATTKTKQQNYVLFFKVQKFNSIINKKNKKKSKTL